jgi:hypothetical protein
VCPDALVNANHARINTLALGSRLATMHPVRNYIEAGGLMSYGAINTDGDASLGMNIAICLAMAGGND